jgi:hypothetical protein
MKTDDNAKRLDELIRATIGRGPLPFDFERWKQEHPRQIEEFRTGAGPRPVPETIPLGKRKTMSRGVKIAVAATILLAALIVVSRFVPSMDGATAAYAKVTQAVRNVPWMHIRYTGYILDEKGNKTSKEGALDTEIWYSFNAQVAIQRFPGGRIVYNDYARQQVYTYNPVSQRIILSSLSSNQLPLTADSPWSWVERNIQRMAPYGGDVMRRREPYQGQDVETFEIVYARETGIPAVRGKIFVDPTTLLPITEERTYLRTRTGKPQRVETGTFDYPPHGPADIYALGLPRDIPTINSLPLPEWQEIHLAYQSYHDEAPTEKYIAVVTRELAIPGNPVESVEICYSDGTCFRDERHSLFTPGSGVGEQWRQQAAEFGNTLDSILKWARAHKAHGEITIDIFDGNHYCGSRRDENGSWSRTEQTFGDRGLTKYDFWNMCPVAHLGWFETQGDADIIQDDYARKNHLIRVEAPGGTFYLNPERDYLCQRRITVNGLEDITQFGQTAEGRWYPRRIMGGGINHTLYLETNPEFPKGIFDPNRLPKADQ